MKIAIIILISLTFFSNLVPQLATENTRNAKNIKNLR